MAGDGAVVIRGRDPGNVDRWELEQRSRMTGWPLVGVGDLADGDGRVVPREDGSRVDVVRRRTREERLRSDDGRLTAFGSVLIEPLRCGAVRVLNAFGTGVADDKRTYVYVERLVRFYCGEQPLLGSVPAWNLAIDEQRAAVDEQRAEALARLDELVVKLRDGAEREGIVVGPRSGRSVKAARPDRRGPEWLDRPEPVAPSTHPTVADGRLEAAPRRPAAVRHRRARAAGRESVRAARRPARRQLCAGWRRQGRVSAVG
jgi:carboxylate-amine ligase